MIRDVVYGQKGDKPGYGQFIEIFMFDDDNHLGIDWTNNGRATVYHFAIKDKNLYDKFKDEIQKYLHDCVDIDAAHQMLEDFLDSDYPYTFLDDYPDYEQEMRSEEEICEYMEEAFDRVWLVRKQNLYCNLLMGAESIQLDILDGVIKAVDEVCDKYNIDFKEPVSDWDYGYWSGILAALRWVLGDEKDCLDT